MAKDIDFKMCGSDTTLKQLKMRHEPDNLRAGMDFKVYTDGNNIGSSIQSGTTVTKTYYMGIEIQTTRHSVCDSIQGGCPVRPGPTLSLSNVNLPGHAPRGTYTCKTTTLDGNGKQIGCVDWSFQVTA
jgi:hypothetical protein